MLKAFAMLPRSTTPLKLWRRWKSSSRASNRVGLYGYHNLKSAKGFRIFAEEAVQKSQELIDRITKVPPSVETIHLFDDLSDTICSVVDCAELCRNTHPDKEYVHEASQTSMKIYEYMQSLNANTVLYNALVKAEQSGLLLTGESKRAGETLRLDFERGGIHLVEEKKLRIHALNLQITNLGREFLENMLDDPGTAEIYPEEKFPKHLRHLAKRIFKFKDGIVTPFLRSHWDPKDYTSGYRMTTESGLLHAALKTAEDAEVRKQIYIAGYSAPKCNLRVLEELIRARHEMAELVGYKSFAEFNLVPTMAASPDVVKAFLTNLSETIRTKADKEHEVLKKFSSEFEQTAVRTIRPWDDAYYVNLMKACSTNLDSQVVASYFPLTQCIKGLELIVESLFGATLKQVIMAPGEAWHPRVQKFALHHSSEGDLGYLYLDLYNRKGKFPGAAHFAIRGGKRISESDYQLPVVALVCNFSSVETSSPLLNHNDVQTLFHEFGHAMHSLLSRTELQHFSGTRTVIDFAEIPSHIFEYFAWDYRVLSRFAKHHETGDTIPQKMFESLCKEKKIFAATELQRQVLFALVDQAFFGEQGGDTTSIVADLTMIHTGQDHVPGTHWQTRFNHLVNYGAGYYSYLYARCFAASIWHKFCLEDPLSREAGDVLRKQLLGYGGSKDPSLILRECLGEEAIVSSPSGGISPSTHAILRELGGSD